MNESFSEFSSMNWHDSLDELSHHDIKAKAIYFNDANSSIISHVSNNPSHHSTEELDSIIQSQEYFFHILVYRKQYSCIQQLIDLAPVNLDKILNSQDHLGTSPIMLALKMCHEFFDYFEILQLLAENDCDITIPEFSGWTALNEAEFQKNPALLDFVRDQYSKHTKAQIKSLKGELSSIPNFYLELKWQTRQYCKCLKMYETYKIFKSGDDIKIDISSSKSRKPVYSVFITNKIQLADHAQRKLYFIDSYKPHQTKQDINTVSSFYSKTELVGKYQCKKYLVSYKLVKKNVHRRKVRNYEFDKEYHILNNSPTPKPIFNANDHRDFKANRFADTQGKLFNLSMWFGQSQKLSRKILVSVLTCMGEVFKSSFPMTSVLDEALYSQVAEDTFPAKIAVGSSILTLNNYSEKIENQPISRPNYINLPLSSLR